jgi:hypothetical protein
MRHSGSLVRLEFCGIHDALLPLRAGHIPTRHHLIGDSVADNFIDALARAV